MVKIFIDFDGTITRRDVGDSLFETFGGERCTELVAEYQEEKLSAAECFRRECAACGTVDLARFHEFLAAQEIDPSFSRFVQFCRQREIEHTILSDGMDAYIKPILERHGLGDVSLRANTLELARVDGSSTVRFVPSFPYQDEVCERCACCKRNHMLASCSDDDRIVYIGEGYSDRCPARYADIVFAKDDLLKYCQRENISYVAYRSFDDVVDRLSSLLSTNGRPDGHSIRKRHQAELARRAVFLGG